MSFWTRSLRAAQFWTDDEPEQPYAFAGGSLHHVNLPHAGPLSSLPGNRIQGHQRQLYVQ